MSRRSVFSSATGLLFLAAALPRLAYLWLARPPFTGPYWALSDSVLRDGSLSYGAVRTADFEPFYPLALAVGRIVTFDSPILVQVGQIGVAAAGAVLLSRLATQLTDRPSIGAAAGLLYAAYPLAIRQSVGGSESALLTTLLVAFAWACARADTTAAGFVPAGLFLGCAMLTRAMTVPLVVLMPAWLLGRGRWRAAFFLAATALAVSGPLLVRNLIVSGGALATRSGVNLYIGNSPHTGALLPRYDLDLLEPEANAIVARERPDLSDADDAPSARARDDLLSRRARQHMAEDIPRTVRQKLWNVAYFFWPVPVPFEIAADDTRVIGTTDGGILVENSRARPMAEVVLYAASYVPLFLLACAGILFRGADLDRDATLWCIVVTFVGVYAWYFPATRYRGPMDFVLMFYAAIATDRIWRRLFPAEEDLPGAVKYAVGV